MKKIENISNAVSLSAPFPYTLVTCLDLNGKPNALGISWLTRTSLNPFLIMISVDQGRYSHDGIRFHKEFVVNYPSASQQEAAWLCGTKSGRDMDKIAESGLILCDSTSVRVPTIEGSTVAFECKVVSEFTTGDHTVFAGEVLAATCSPEHREHLFVSGGFSFMTLSGTE